MEQQRLILCGKQLSDAQTLFAAGVRSLSTLQLIGRLRGGKGGFGALLRAGARSSTNQNTDACRDLNGRRLRHVTADEKLKGGLQRLHYPDRTRMQLQIWDALQAEQLRKLVSTCVLFDSELFNH